MMSDPKKKAASGMNTACSLLFYLVDLRYRYQCFRRGYSASVSRPKASVSVSVSGGEFIQSLAQDPIHNPGTGVFICTDSR